MRAGSVDQMRILGLGVDLADIERVGRVLEK